MLRELPEGWESVKIGDIATIEKNVATPDSLNGNSQKFIGLENIERDSGRLVNFSEISGDELRSTKFKFTPEHILYGKLRPYLNKVFLPDFEGVCSTDIVTIKPNPKKVVKKFLELVLKGSDFVDYATTRSIGANLPRVSPSTVLDYSFALPPLPIQLQIVAVLEQAEAVKRQRREADALTGALLQSVFREMFGNDAKEVSKWEWQKLGDISTLITKGATPTSYGYSFQKSGIKFVKIENIINNQIDESSIKQFISPEAHENQKRSILESGDILFSIAGTIGNVCLVKEKDLPSNINQAIAVIKGTSHVFDPNFLLFFLRTNLALDQITKKSRGVALNNVSLGDVRDIFVMTPPLALQHQFARVVQDVEQIRDQQVASGKAIEGLCEGLMQRAFAGELAV